MRVPDQKEFIICRPCAVKEDRESPPGKQEFFVSYGQCKNCKTMTTIYTLDDWPKTK